MEKKIGKYLYENRKKFRQQGLMLHDNHSAPLTRRELLASGFYASCFSLAMPSAASLLWKSNQAIAATAPECGIAKQIAGVPVIQIHRDGGCRLWGDGLAIGLDDNGKPANFQAASGGMSEIDFFNYGLSPDYHPSKTGWEYVQFGGHPMSPISYVYQSAVDYFGDRLKDIDSKLSIISMCTRTQDDTSNTKQSLLPSAIAFRGKADFNLVSNVSGTNLNGMGAIPMFTTMERSTVVSDPNISRLLRTGLDSLPVDVKQSYIDTVKNIVAPRLTRAESLRLLGCSTQAAKDKLATYAQDFNPYNLDPQLAAVFNNANNSSERNIGTIAYMLKNGIALAAGMSFGGYDYHDQTSQGYFRDRSLFQNTIWKLIDYYHRANLPLILFLTSDGATYSNNAVDPRVVRINGVDQTINLAANTGDRDRNGGSVFLILSPSDRNIKPYIKYHQVGHGQAQGSIARTGNDIGYDQTNYASAAVETMNRAMQILSGSTTLASDFQNAADGLRFNDNLEAYVALKKS